MLDLVGNPEDRCSHNEAHIIKVKTVPKLTPIASSIENHNIIIALERPVIYEPRHEKTNILVSNLVLHIPGCTASEDG